MRSTSKYGWYVIAVLTLVNLISAVDRFMMGIVMVPLKTALDLSDTQLGLLQGLAFSLLYCLAGIPLGRLADVASRRFMLFLGCLGWTLATGACAFANSFGVLFATRVVVGLGEATLMPVAISLMGVYIARHQLATATSIFMMGATAGKAVAFIGGGAVLAAVAVQGGITLFGHEFADWQTLFLCAALPGIPIALMVLTIREPTRPSGSKARSSLRDLYGHFSKHSFEILTFTVAGICMILMAHLFAAWAPSFFVRRFELGVTQAGLIVGLTVVAIGPLGGILGGVIADRLLKRGIEAGPLIVICGSLVLAIPGTMLMAFGGSVELAVIGYGWAQMAVLAGGPQSYVGIQMLTPLRHRGMLGASYLAVTTLAAMGVGPTAIGIFSDIVWTDPVMGLGYSILSVLLIFATIGLIAAALTYRHFAGAVRAAYAEDEEPISA